MPSTGMAPIKKHARSAAAGPAEMIRASYAVS